MLAYPDFEQPFEIHTDASHQAIGSVIVQRRPDGTMRCPVAFFSKKMTPTQQLYTVGEKELMAIVETLRVYRTILLATG